MIDGETHGTVIRANTIRETRRGEARTQLTAVRIGKKAGSVLLEANTLEADKPVEDLRGEKAGR